ncbi:MAG TPA: hypothetical protein VN822_13180 [Candidatus Acidoferrales bacterium]|nr:hypothetical protein [Candidatus Acidoferrales bacterium]
MSDQYGMGEAVSSFLPPVAVRSRSMVEELPASLPERPTLKNSITAGAFLVLYLAAYLAAGFAGMAMLEWAWLRIFG